MARINYAPSIKQKFDTNQLIETYTFGDTTFGLTDQAIMLYSTLSKDWGILYNGRYRNDLGELWSKIKTL